MAGRVICILGMHRSGTSCLAGSLQQVGLYLGDVFTENPYNLKGNRENKRIMLLQEAVLEANGGSWHSPPETLVWSSEQRHDLCDIVDGYKEYPVWGFKDPRTIFTLSGVEECIGRMQLVGTFRNPKSVVSSLMRRNPHIGDEDYWFNLWNRYNLRLLGIWNDNHFPIINFDADAESYLKSLKILTRQLGLRNNFIYTILQGGFLSGWGGIMLGKKRNVFFDPSLRSSITMSTRGMPDNVTSTYRKLQEISL